MGKGRSTEKGKGKLALGTGMATASGGGCRWAGPGLKPQAWGSEGPQEVSEWGRDSLSCALEGTLSPAAVESETGQSKQSWHHSLGPGDEPAAV